VDGRTVRRGGALTSGAEVGQAPAGIQDPATAPAPHRGEPAPLRRSPRASATRRLPYLLVLPSLVAFAALLGYPLYQVVRISLLKLDLGELIRRETVFVGLTNYRSILADPFFWSVVLRTVLFTAVSVSLTMVLATLVALLLERLGRGLRLAVEVSLVLTWAMPALTATVVWQWLFDTQFGVVNWLLTTLRLGQFAGHSWFATGLSTFAVITIIVVWQAIPFVAITLYAGLTAVPGELREAMRVDGAGPWRMFWSLLLPALRPLFMVTCFLSIIWDFKVFTQVWLVRQGGPNRQTVTLAVYAYQEGIATSHFGRAAAISLVMVVLLLAALVYYIRLMLRTQEDL
jgi:N,N'-diacetylchitobiose transport system permease protein